MTLLLVGAFKRLKPMSPVHDQAGNVNDRSDPPETAAGLIAATVSSKELDDDQGRHGIPGRSGTDPRGKGPGGGSGQEHLPAGPGPGLFQPGGEQEPGGRSVRCRG